MSAADKARALLAAATPGPWINWNGDITHDPSGDTDPAEQDLLAEVCGPISANSELIAQAPTLLAALADEVEQLREENARLQAVVDAIRESQQCLPDEDGYVSHEVEDVCVRCHESAYDIYNQSGSE